MESRYPLLNNLQILRAMAALSVVVYHVLHTAREYGLPADVLLGLHGWGKNGVDVFFVISGFVMVYAQEQRAKPPVLFLWDRVKRIVPLYWLVTFVFGFVTMAMPSVSRSGAPSAGKLVASLAFLARPLYLDLPAVFVGWSLEYEMLFYLLFAVTIGVRRRVWAFLGMGVCLVLLAHSGFAGWIVLEFLFGMGCALVFRHRFITRLARPIAFAGAALLVAPLFVTVRGPDVLVSGLPATLLVLGAAAMPQNRSVLWSFLGAASYSVYLVQVFTIPVCYKVASRFLSSAPGDVPAVLAVLVTAAVGSALYWGVEKPIAQALKRVRVAPERGSFGAAA